MTFRFAAAWWSIGVLMLAAVLVLSLLPPGEGTALLPDKLLHFLTYFLLGFWFVSLTPRRSLFATGAVMAFGGFVELLQGLTATRHPEWLDFAANSAGVMLALLLVIFLPVNPFAWLERRLPEFAR